MAEIGELRDRMDELTLRMVELLKDRMDVSRQIGDLKISSGRGVSDEAREASLRRKVVGMCRGIGLDESVAKRLLNHLINESIKVQSEGRPTHLSAFMRAKQMEYGGRRIIHMGVGEPDFMPPGMVRDALSEAFDRGFVRYGQPGGMPSFRKAISEHASKKFGAPVQPDQVIVTPGGRFSVYAAFHTLLDAGDEAIVIEPAWPAYRECAMSAGVKIKTIRTSLKDGWEPSVGEVRDAMTPDTRMIILNYPNNPTGKVLQAGTLDGIMEAAAAGGMYVLSDEIYSEYAPAEWKSILEYDYNNSIVVQSFSKSHAMTGFRIGYAVSSKEVVSRMSKLASLCLTSVAEPIQYAAMKALGEDTSGNADAVRERLDVLAGKAAEMGLEFAKPDGAMYLFARIPGVDSAFLVQEALKDGLLLAPGTGFGDYGDFVRISACEDKKTLIEGMYILQNVVDRIK